MQTSYSVDRAGTAEQEAEAAVEAPKRVRRTREQIEQEKIVAAEERIEKLRREQQRRRVLAAHGKIEEAITLLITSGLCVRLVSGGGMADYDIHDTLHDIRAALRAELGE